MSEQLFDLARSGKHDELISLLQNGADANTINSYGRTILFDAIQSKNQKTVEIILENGGNPNFLSKVDHYPLNSAIGWLEDGRNEIARILLERGANPNQKITKSMITPLHSACLHKNTELVELLLAHGADPNAQTTEGKLPSDMTTLKKLKKILENSDTSPKSRQEDIAQLNKLLLEASENASLSKIKELLAKGAELECRDEFDESTPLLMVMKPNNSTGTLNDKKVKAFNWLIENGADVNAKNNAGTTPILFACKLDRIDLVKELEKKGAKFNINKYGSTALHYAVGSTYNSDKKLWQLLLSKGCNVNDRNKEKRTPLHEAVTSWNLEATKFLVSAGADLSLKDVEGNTSRDIAENCSMTKILKYLDSVK